MFTHQHSVSLESKFPYTVDIHFTRTSGDLTEVMYSTHSQSNKQREYEDLI